MNTHIIMLDTVEKSVRLSKPQRRATGRGNVLLKLAKGTVHEVPEELADELAGMGFARAATAEEIAAGGPAPTAVGAVTGAATVETPADD